MKLINSGILRHSSFWLAIALTLLLPACQGAKIHQTYEGPAKPENEVGTLSIPESFNILFINKKKFGPTLYSGNSKIGFLPGSHHIIIYYKEFWEIPGDEHERIESKPISIKFDAEAGQHYQIKFVPPENVDEARIYVQNPSIEFVNKATNTSAANSIEYNVYTRSFFTDVFGEEDGSTTESVPASTVGMIPPTTPAPTVAAPDATTSTSGTVQEDARALDMLKYWWESASETQRKAFQDWANQ